MSHITPDLRLAEYEGGYVIRFGFADGREGRVDLEDMLGEGVFAPLRDPEVFRSFRLDPELNTVVWPTGADLAPEFVYERVLAGNA